MPYRDNSSESGLALHCILPALQAGWKSMLGSVRLLQEESKDSLGLLGEEIVEFRDGINHVQAQLYEQLYDKKVLWERSRSQEGNATISQSESNNRQEETTKPSMMIVEEQNNNHSESLTFKKRPTVEQVVRASLDVDASLPLSGNITSPSSVVDTSSEQNVIVQIVLEKDHPAQGSILIVPEAKLDAQQVDKSTEDKMSDDSEAIAQRIVTAALSTLDKALSDASQSVKNPKEEEGKAILQAQQAVTRSFLAKDSFPPAASSAPVQSTDPVSPLMANTNDESAVIQPVESPRVGNAFEPKKSSTQSNRDKGSLLDNLFGFMKSDPTFYLAQQQEQAKQLQMKKEEQDKQPDQIVKVAQKEIVGSDVGTPSVAKPLVNAFSSKKGSAAPAEVKEYLIAKSLDASFSTSRKADKKPSSGIFRFFWKQQPLTTDAAVDASKPEELEVSYDRPVATGVKKEGRIIKPIVIETKEARISSYKAVQNDYKGDQYMYVEEPKNSPKTPATPGPLTQKMGSSSPPIASSKDEVAHVPSISTRESQSASFGWFDVLLGKSSSASDTTAAAPQPNNRSSPSKTATVESRSNIPSSRPTAALKSSPISPVASSTKKSPGLFGLFYTSKETKVDAKVSTPNSSASPDRIDRALETSPGEVKNKATSWFGPTTSRRVTSAVPRPSLGEEKSGNDKPSTPVTSPAKPKFFGLFSPSSISPVSLSPPPSPAVTPKVGSSKTSSASAPSVSTISNNNVLNLFKSLPFNPSVTAPPPQVRTTNAAMNPAFQALVSRSLNRDSSKLARFQRATDSYRVGSLSAADYLAGLEELFGPVLAEIVSPLCSELPEKELAVKLKASYDKYLKTQAVKKQAELKAQQLKEQKVQKSQEQSKTWFGSLFSSSDSAKTNSSSLSTLQTKPLVSTSRAGPPPTTKPIAAIPKAVMTRPNALQPGANYTKGRLQVPDKVPPTKQASVLKQMTRVVNNEITAKDLLTYLVNDLGVPRVESLVGDMVAALPRDKGGEFAKAAQSLL
eukprot:scaffold1497_cov170-Ochromonas_danica.AAC.1